MNLMNGIIRYLQQVNYQIYSVFIVRLNGAGSNRPRSPCYYKIVFRNL